MTFTYDNLTDSILVFSKRAKDFVKGSATVGNLVLDFTKEGKIVGLEIRKATQFFRDLGFPKKPSEIDSASLTTQQTPYGFVLLLNLKFDHQTQRLPLFISSESPQLAMA